MSRKSKVELTKEELEFFEQCINDNLEIKYNDLEDDKGETTLEKSIREFEKEMKEELKNDKK